ncbi:hypothetical protein Q8A67_005653 [Cirrhinus molitorella]|uniref:Immunoglobulin domain-containing protein n=1 Tax=Cirrhinus molitorella TaxID=172907 RepID=A0AA88TSU9_9TELE|nr:hypothetical protein Q8A67_005653 [Cirrhinus molitorella]
MAAYSLEKFFIVLFAVFAFFVHGASDVGTDRVLVSVMKGDSVTFHTNITVNQQDRVKWYFTDTLIAQLSLSYICTDVQCHEDNESFRDRLNLDHQTGDLTITDINTSDGGVYQLKIFRISSPIRNIFDVAVHDVAAEMKRKSVKRGESVILDVVLDENPNNVMMWYFNDTLIAEITGDPSKICKDERFRNRLKVVSFGSLIITNTGMTDSGMYKVQIKSSRSRYSTTSIKSFNVSVTSVSDSGLSPAAIAVICVAVVVLLVAAAVVYVICHCCGSSGKDKGSPHDLKGSQHRASGNGVHFQSLSESDSEAE